VKRHFIHFVLTATVGVLSASHTPTAYPNPRDSDTFGPAPLFPTTKPSPLDLNGITLSVATSESHPTRGRPLKVAVTLANALDDPLWLPLRRQPEKDFVATVTSQSGAPAPLTPAGVAAYSRPPIDSAGIAVVDVPKDHPRHALLDLSAIYDLSTPGEYTVIVRVYVFQPGHRDRLVPVTSPPFQFEVPPGNGK